MRPTALAVTIAAIFCAMPALGHSWYPIECCAGYDCSEIPASRVKATPGGYLIDGAHAIPYSQVRNSPDNHYHACFPQPGQLKCFFAPVRSF